MGLKETLEVEETDRDILIRKAPAEVHRKLRDLTRKIAYKESRNVLKPDLVIELLLSHPKMKSL